MWTLRNGPGWPTKKRNLLANVGVEVTHGEKVKLLIESDIARCISSFDQPDMKFVRVRFLEFPNNGTWGDV